MSPLTIRMYREAGTQAHAYLRERDLPTDSVEVRKRHIEEFLISLRETPRTKTGRPGSSATASARFSALRRFFSWFEEEGEIEHSPMLKMKPPQVEVVAPDVLTDNEERRLLDACRGSELEDRRDAAVLRLMLDTGRPRVGFRAVPRREPNWDFLYDLARFHLELQLSGVGAVDTKLMGVVGIATAEIAFIPAVFAITGIHTLAAWFLFGVMFVAYLTAVAAAARGLWAQRWAIGLKSLDEVEEAYSAGHSERDIRRAAQATLRDGYAENAPKTTAKQNMLRLALIGLVTQTVGASLSLLVVALSHGHA